VNVCDTESDVAIVYSWQQRALWFNQDRCREQLQRLIECLTRLMAARMWNRIQTRARTRRRHRARMLMRMPLGGSRLS
jgi:hypothetical protein